MSSYKVCYLLEFVRRNIPSTMDTLNSDEEVTNVGEEIFPNRWVEREHAVPWWLGLALNKLRVFLAGNTEKYHVSRCADNFARYGATNFHRIFCK